MFVLCKNIRLCIPAVSLLCLIWGAPGYFAHGSVILAHFCWTGDVEPRQPVPHGDGPVHLPGVRPRTHAVPNLEEEGRRR